jgi:CYTH domain-containing protein
MSIRRRFLIASSMARLIQTERGGQRIVEGYFPEREGRSSYVCLDGNSGNLVLIRHGPHGLAEERTEIPQSHAEALLAVTIGEVEYVRTSLILGPEVHVCQFHSPGPLDFVDVAFEHEQEAGEFQPPLWFGSEVSTDPRFRNQSLALAAFAGAPEQPLSNAALDSLLDILEGRSVPRHRTWLKKRAAH